MPKSQLGEVVGALLATLPPDDQEPVAPEWARECGEDYVRRQLQRSQAILETHGWTAVEVIVALTLRRVSDKWVYFSGIDHVIPTTVCNQCTVLRAVVGESTIEPQRDPTQVLHLECGHMVV